MDFRDITIADLTRRVRTGEFRAENVARDTLNRIHSYNPKLNAFVALRDSEQILADARAIDKCVSRGSDPGALAGVPTAVKDIEDVAGLPTTFGSKLFADRPPAARDSIGVQRLRAAGAVIIGKTNTSEFAYNDTTNNPLFGRTTNPWNPAYSCGGSSGGSAVALAAGLVPLALGSDGGGSLRIPASACGFSGYKPSTGLVPFGDAEPPLCGTLIVRGPMARSVRDTVAALNIMKGAVSSDIFSLPDDGENWTASWPRVNPPKIMIWSPTLGFAEVDGNVREICESAVQRLREAGIKIVQRDRITESNPLKDWVTMWSAGLANKLGDYIRKGEFKDIDPALQELIKSGLRVTGTEYMRALDACHSYNWQLEAAFTQAPIILTPTCAGQVPKSGHGGMINGRETRSWSQLTQLVNMTRNPAASVYAGVNEDGLPVGLQVIGRQRCDLETLAAAESIERIMGGPGRANI